MGAGDAEQKAAEGAGAAGVDFFVSYAEEDRHWAEWITWQLEAAGFTTVVQTWDIRPGDHYVAAIDGALTRAKRVLVVLSRAYVASPDVAPQWHHKIQTDPLGVGRRLVPVRVDDVSPTGLLGHLVPVDLLGLNEVDAGDRLRAGLREGRLKPSSPPSFPGAPAPAPAFPPVLDGPKPSTSHAAAGSAVGRVPSGPQIRRIASALGRLGIVHSPAGLRSVVSQLPSDLVERLPVDPGRLDVYLVDLVTAAFEYLHSLDELLEVLDFYEHGTRSMRRLVDVVETVTAELAGPTSNSKGDSSRDW